MARNGTIVVKGGDGMNKLHIVTFILVIVGGLNWLLLGLFGWEIGSLFGGMDAMISRVIYLLVGLSAIYELATHKSRCRECDTMQRKPGVSGPGM